MFLRVIAATRRGSRIRRRTRRAGGGRVFEHPRLTRLLVGHVATRGKRHPKEFSDAERAASENNYDEAISAIFRSGQTLGHQRLSKKRFCLFRQFFRQIGTQLGNQKSCSATKKAHKIALLALFDGSVFRFDLRSTV